MIRILTLLALIVMSGAANARSSLDGDPQWETCTTNSECVVVLGLCSYTAVNSKFTETAEAHYAPKRMVVNCSSVPGDKPEAASCVKERCVPVPPETPTPVAP